MPPPSPSFPLSDSRTFRLPPLGPPSALYTPSLRSPADITMTNGGFCTSALPSPALPSPSLRGLDSAYSESMAKSFFGPYSGSMPIHTGGPLMQHKPSLCSVSSLLSEGMQDIPSASSSVTNSPIFKNTQSYWSYSPTGSTGSADTRSSSIDSGSNRLGDEFLGQEDIDVKEEDEDLALAGHKRRRTSSGYSGDIKRSRRDSYADQDMREMSAEENSDDQDDKEEYDVLGRKKPKTPRTPVSWDPEDDRKLIQLKEVEKLGWKQISTYFKKRTSHACQFRWRRLTSGTLKYYQGQRRPPVIPSPITPPSYNDPPRNISLHPISPSQVMKNLSLPTPPLREGSERERLSREESISRISKAVTYGVSTPPMMNMTPVASRTPTPSNSESSTRSSTPLAGKKRPLEVLDEGVTGVGMPWTEQEDKLIADKNWEFKELNAVLPHRSENEIWMRMGQLRWGIKGWGKRS